MPKSEFIYDLDKHDRFRRVDFHGSSKGASITNFFSDPHFLPDGVVLIVPRCGGMISIRK